MRRTSRVKKPEDVQLEFFPTAVLDLLGHRDEDALEFRLRGSKPLLRIQVTRSSDGFAWRASVHGAYRTAFRKRPEDSPQPLPSRGQALVAAADYLRSLLPMVPTDDRALVKAWLGSVYAHAQQSV